MMHFSIDCRPPYLVASFREPQQMLSWSVTHPGLHIAQRVVWLEVSNKDLPKDCDPIAVIRSKIEEASHADAVTLVTSRDVGRHHLVRVCVEDAAATCLTTVGLSNGERVGTRSTEPVPLPGTINTLVHVEQPLSEAALLETMSIVTQARTAAIIDARVRRRGVAVTGTGTDCIVIAAPIGPGAERYAGMHTAIGEAVGRATYEAISAGVETWKVDFERATRARLAAAAAVS